MIAPHLIDIAAELRPALTQLYVTYFRQAARSDLTGPQLTILSRLKAEGPARISELARREGIRMPTASNALHQLEQRGLVSRIRDTSDRRGVRVQLTPTGTTELLRVGKERDEQIADMLSSLPPEQVKQIEEIVPIIQNLASNYSASVFEE